MYLDFRWYLLALINVIAKDPVTACVLMFHLLSFRSLLFKTLYFVWKEFTGYLTLVSGKEEANIITEAQSYIRGNWLISECFFFL